MLGRFPQFAASAGVQKRVAMVATMKAHRIGVPIEFLLFRAFVRLEFARGRSCGAEVTSCAGLETRVRCDYGRGKAIGCAIEEEVGSVPV
jgi:hypothetical protein